MSGGGGQEGIHHDRSLFFLTTFWILPICRMISQKILVPLLLRSDNYDDE